VTELRFLFGNVRIFCERKSLYGLPFALSLFHRTLTSLAARSSLATYERDFPRARGSRSRGPWWPSRESARIGERRWKYASGSHAIGRAMGAPSPTVAEGLPAVPSDRRTSIRHRLPALLHTIQTSRILADRASMTGRRRSPRRRLVHVHHSRRCDSLRPRRASDSVPS
jgi:hypothetical protein